MPYARLVKTAQQCLHLASEFSGDQTERDRELNRTMDRLHCGEMDSALDAQLRQVAPRSQKARELQRLLRQFRN